MNGKIKVNILEGERYPDYDIMKELEENDNIFEIPNEIYEWLEKVKDLYQKRHSYLYNLIQFTIDDLYDEVTIENYNKRFLKEIKGSE